MGEAASAAGGAMENTAAVLGAARDGGSGDLVAANEGENAMTGIVVCGGREIARVDQGWGGGHNRQGPS